MPETPIEPALTAEEWNPVCPTGEFTYTGPRVSMDDPEAWIEGGELWLPAHCDGEEIVRNRHGLAALALYGQPFGFTREDVALLRAAAVSCRGDDYWFANELEEPEPEQGEERRHERIARRIDALAARVAALLPPE